MCVSVSQRSHDLTVWPGTPQYIYEVSVRRSMGQGYGQKGHDAGGLSMFRCFHSNLPSPFCVTITAHLWLGSLVIRAVFFAHLSLLFQQDHLLLTEKNRRYWNGALRILSLVVLSTVVQLLADRVFCWGFHQKLDTVSSPTDYIHYYPKILVKWTLFRIFLVLYQSTMVNFV